jgi:hypothetical protein
MERAQRKRFGANLRTCPGLSAVEKMRSGFGFCLAATRRTPPADPRSAPVPVPPDCARYRVAMVTGVPEEQRTSPAIARVSRTGRRCHRFRRPPREPMRLPHSSTVPSKNRPSQHATQQVGKAPHAPLERLAALPDGLGRSRILVWRMDTGCQKCGAICFTCSSPMARW